MSHSESENEPNDAREQNQSKNINVMRDMVCSRCGALYINGEWTWNALSDNNKHVVCPACKRIEENDPAGRVIVKGSYFTEHKDDVIHLIENISKSELSDHPLERLMDIKMETKDAEFTTTGIHLARRIGYALQLAYDGALSSTQIDDDHIIVCWTKDSEETAK